MSVQAAARAARWAAYKNLLRPGVHKLNIYWNEIENSPVVPSPNPVVCPGGYRQVCSWPECARNLGGILSCAMT